jgi:ABC-type transport system involved in cytochrome c biogenesis permease subunit
MLQLLPPPLLLLLLLLLILLLIVADAQQLRVYHVVQLPVAAARQSITAKQIRTS